MDRGNCDGVTPYTKYDTVGDGWSNIGVMFERIANWVQAINTYNCQVSDGWSFTCYIN